MKKKKKKKRGQNFRIYLLNNFPLHILIKKCILILTLLKEKHLFFAALWAIERHPLGSKKPSFENIKPPFEFLKSAHWRCVDCTVSHCNLLHSPNWVTG